MSRVGSPPTSDTIRGIPVNGGAKGRPDDFIAETYGLASSDKTVAKLSLLNREFRIRVSRAPIWRDAKIDVVGFPGFSWRLFDETWLVDGRSDDALEGLIHAYLVVGHARHRIDGEQEVSLSEPEKPSRTYLEHPNFPFVLVDEHLVDVTDLRTVAVDHFPSADILDLIC
jgi:hypothetical protein